jgi:hypothetical protein
VGTQSLAEADPSALVSPTAQDWHDVSLVDAMSGLNLPVSHFVQDGAPPNEYDPAAQSEQEEAPGPENLPAAHGEHASVLVVFAGLKKPASHSRHSMRCT